MPASWSDLGKQKQVAHFHVLIPRPHYSYSKKYFSWPRDTSDHLQITLQCLGAAAAVSAPFVPEWAVGYTGGNVGGLINAMLLPVNKLGKVLMVLLSLSVTANNSPTIYSMGNAFQTLIPPLVVVPRYVFSVFSTAV